MNILKISLFSFLFTLLSFQIYATDKSSGCGLGWQVLKKHSLVSSVLRSTTNGLFFNQTFGMTSGTSGCARHSLVKNESRGIHFVEANYHQLMIDMAQGKGEYLMGLAKAVDYKGDMATFGKLIQKNYGKLFTSLNTTPLQLYQNFKNLFINDPQIKKDYMVM